MNFEGFSPTKAQSEICYIEDYFLKVQSFAFDKGLIRLALRDKEEWEETAHTKSYRVDTSPKCAE